MGPVVLTLIASMAASRVNRVQSSLCGHPHTHLNILRPVCTFTCTLCIRTNLRLCT